MRRAGAALVIACAALAAPAQVGAEPATVPVNVLFQEFSPSQTDLLPGETVEWTNVSERRHTITANDGSFDSGDFFGGDRYTHTYDAAGAYPYHCTVHDGMVGQVDVRRVTLGSLPTAPIPAGQHVDFDGRTADPGSPVTIEADTGDGFHAVASATPAADGTWKVPVTATKTADFRATSGGDPSETRRLLVTDRRVLIRRTPRGVSVTVAPALPYARVQLQIEERERFGWWPAAFKRLDYVSSAVFAVPRGSRVRVVLVDRDGWSPVALSPMVRAGSAR